MVDLFGSTKAAEWMVEAVAFHLASGDPIDQAAAAGLVVRLWEPVDAQDRAVGMARMRAGGLPEPLALARNYVLAQVDGKAVEEFVQTESASIVCLLMEMERFTRDLQEEAAAAVAASLVRRRDRLESLAFILRLWLGRSVKDDLAALDRAISTHHSTLGSAISADPLPRPWLRTVAAQEPHSWWGALVRPGE